MTAVGNKSTVILKRGIISLSGRRASLLAIQVILPVQDVVLQSLWQRQEAHKNRRAETKATEATPDPQTTEMLQTAGVLCGERGEGGDTEWVREGRGGRRTAECLAVSEAERSPFFHLAAGRCRPTAAAPSQPPSAWSTGSRDPGSP